MLKPFNLSELNILLLATLALGLSLLGCFLSFYAQTGPQTALVLSMLALGAILLGLVLMERFIRKKERALAENFRRTLENEKALGDSTERLRMLDEVTEESIMIHDQGIIVEVNRALAHMLDYEPFELVGRHLSDFMDQGSTETTKVHLEKGYPEGPYEIMAKRKNGTTFPLEVQGRDFVYKGRKLRVSSGRDITHRKRIEQAFIESEERFRRFAEVTKEGIFIHDKGIIVDVNPALQDMTGYRASEIIGTEGYFLLDEVSVAKVRRMQEIGYETKPYELKVRRKDGTLFSAEFHGRAFSFGGRSLRVVSVWDVTERKKAEEALRRSEERFRNMLENSNEGITLAAADGTTLYVSPSNKKLSGFETAERQGHNMLEMVHPGDLARAKKTLEKLLENPGSTLREQFRIRHKAGHWMDCEITLTNLLDNPDVGGVMVNSRDVTERNKAEEELRRSEENFRNLIESAPDPILVNREGKILYVNKRFLDFMGYANKSELLGGSALDLVHPDDRGMVAQRIKNTLRGEANPSAEVRLLKKDGSPTAAEASSIGIGFEGSMATMVILRDITERKKSQEALRDSEEKFRSLIENSHDIISIAERDGKVRYMSPSVKRILGYDPSERLGQGFTPIMHPDDLERMRGEFSKLLKSKGTPVTVAFRLRHKDGSWKQIESTGINLLENPSVQGIIYNMRDVTEKKKAEEALMKFERLSTIGEMAAGLAHEIRNPLASIFTAAQLLKRKQPAGDEASGSYIETILGQSQRLEQLVRDTMDYARAEKVTPWAPFPLKEALESALRLCQVQFGPAHAKVKVEWDLPKKDLQLTANPQRIQQVLINLILNAYQAMPDGGTMRIGMRSLGDMVLIRVEDSGPGIKEGDLERLFEPFFTTKGGGSGLGLAISQRIAKEYGGKIGVERLEPKGAAFVFEIPMGKGGAA